MEYAPRHKSEIPSGPNDIAPLLGRQCKESRRPAIVPQDRPMTFARESEIYFIYKSNLFYPLTEMR